MKLLIKQGKAYIDGAFLVCDILAEDEKITAVGKNLDIPQGDGVVIQAEGKYIFPGSIDTHVHIRAPGNDRRETFLTGTMAAAAGGTTTVVEQPICTVTPYCLENLEKRKELAEKEAITDFLFYGAAGCDDYEKIHEIKDFGIAAYKTFLQAPPQERKQEFVNLYMDDDGKLYRGMEEVAKTGHMLMVHGENHPVIGWMEEKLRKEGKTQGLAHVWSRPSYTEAEITEKIIGMASEIGLPVFFAHISSWESMELIKQAKFQGKKIFCETCIHYLTLTEKALEEFGPFAKSNPPVRSQENQEKLWQYVNDGITVDAVGSDHSPFLYEEKARWEKDIFKAPAGLVGIDIRFPLMLHSALEGKTTLETVAELSAARPARLLGLFPQKGVIRPGSDADLVIVNPKGETCIARGRSYSNSGESQVAYDGKRLKGSVDYTIVRGKIVCTYGKADKSLAGWGTMVYPKIQAWKEGCIWR